MDEDMIAGIIIMAATCFGCGALFFGIGIVARHSKKPFAFWAGTTVNPERVSDIAGYNRASARMWKWYSFPYFSAGILACLEPVSHVFAVLAAGLLGLSCFPGLLALVRAYRRIERKYISK